jgi:hypothetical protein
MSEACKHPDFLAGVTVNRLEDIGALSADIRIACAVCHEPFKFVGAMEVGLLPDQPATSADGTELRVPIIPASGGPTGSMGFRIRADSGPTA